MNRPMKHTKTEDTNRLKNETAKDQRAEENEWKKRAVKPTFVPTPTSITWLRPVIRDWYGPGVLSVPDAILVQLQWD
jgi:hypothetical protein